MGIQASELGILPAIGYKHGIIFLVDPFNLMTVHIVLHMKTNVDNIGIGYKIHKIK